MTVVYQGERTIDGIVVTRDGKPLDQRLDIAQLSGIGFDWGFDGSPARQLALALLADHLGDPRHASILAPDFCRGMVALFDNEWELTDQDIDNALAVIKQTAS